MTIVRTRRAPSARALLLASTLAVAGLACSSGDEPRAALATAKTSPATAAGDTGVTARADAGRTSGRTDAKVWLIEISDFQCPYCKMWHDSTYPAIRREYVEPGKVRMAYVNLPLSSHKHAWPAAEAAMCASVQGKFWPVHDGIFDTQEQWARLPDAVPTFAGIAEKAGVEMGAWRTCMDRHQTRTLIAADADRATASGIQSTPSFIVGNQLVAGAYPTEVFRQVLDSALAAADRGGSR